MLDLKNVTIGLNEEFFTSDACGNRTSYKSTVREILQYLFDFSILVKDLSPYVLKEPKRSKRLEIPTTLYHRGNKIFAQCYRSQYAQGKARLPC